MIDDAIPTSRPLDDDLPQGGVARSRRPARCRAPPGCRRTASPRSGRCARPRASSAAAHRAGRPPRQQQQKPRMRRRSRRRRPRRRCRPRVPRRRPTITTNRITAGMNRIGAVDQRGADAAAPAGELPGRLIAGRGATGCCQPPGGTGPPYAGAGGRRVRARRGDSGPGGAGDCGPAGPARRLRTAGALGTGDRGPGDCGPGSPATRRPAGGPRRGSAGLSRTPWPRTLVRAAGGLGGVLEHHLLAPAQEAHRPAPARRAAR